MDLKSQFNTQSEWELYRNKIRKAFRKILIGGDVTNHLHENGFIKFKEATNIMSKIDWRYSTISRLKVDIRHSRTTSQEAMVKYHKEIDELVEVLNENFVMEILLGD